MARADDFKEHLDADNSDAHAIPRSLTILLDVEAFFEWNEVLANIILWVTIPDIVQFDDDCT
jgi:hypothetical protein